MVKHKRLNRELDTVSKMIALYCRNHHESQQGGLCSECQSLQDFAHHRIQHCRYGLNKPTCAKCPVHCFQPRRREQIRQVMRYAGPRMLLHHPRLALLHLIDGLKNPPAQ